MTMETADAVRVLAEYASSLSSDTVPLATKETATVLILDTLGTIVASSERPEMRNLSAVLPTTGEARLLGGRSRCTEPVWAAFANATAGSFLELDQGERPTGHPALHVLPAALAHAESQHASGSDLLTAFIVGYEVQSRIANAFALRWPVHPHGTLGTPGAAAALARLDRSNSDEIRASINAGASLTTATSWTSCLEGATTRNAFAGMTAQAAFIARMLVKAGFTTAHDAVFDTFATILGEPNDLGALTAGLGETHAVDDAYIKFHAACALVHPALDAVLDAVGADRRSGAYPPHVARRTLAAEDVESVDILTTERASRLRCPDVQNELAAKFSLPFAVATLLVNGATSPGSFAGENLTREDVRDLARRVRVHSEPAMTARWPLEFRAEARIRLRDGTVLNGQCVNPYGSRDNPPSRDDVRAKFKCLTADKLPADSASSSWETGMALKDSTDVTDWLDGMLGPRARPARDGRHDGAPTS